MMAARSVVTVGNETEGRKVLKELLYKIKKKFLKKTCKNGWKRWGTMGSAF